MIWLLGHISFGVGVRSMQRQKSASAECAPTFSIRIVADCVLQSNHATRKLKRATFHDFTTKPAIIFIHCWRVVVFCSYFKEIRGYNFMITVIVSFFTSTILSKRTMVLSPTFFIVASTDLLFKVSLIEVADFPLGNSTTIS